MGQILGKEGPPIASISSGENAVLSNGAPTSIPAPSTTPLSSSTAVVPVDSKSKNFGVLLLKEGVAAVFMLASVALAAKIVASIMDPYKDQKNNAKKRVRTIQTALGLPADLQLDEYELIMAGNVVNPATLSHTTNDLKGWDPLLKELTHEVLAPLAHPSLCYSPLFRPPKGVLLYGPPGTGKTMLAKCLAGQNACFFINITASSILSKWLGDANRLVRATFTLAHKLAPSIVFIDEVDSLLGVRKESDHEAVVAVKTEFMQLWDGIESLGVDDDEGGQGGVVVLGATNRPWMVDEAILRRFTLQYEVGLPSGEQRREILAGYLRQHDQDMRRRREGVVANGSDIAELCRTAVRQPLTRLMDSPHFHNPPPPPRGRRRCLSQCCESTK